jgi:hypothetical protein
MFLAGLLLVTLGGAVAFFLSAQVPPAPVPRQEYAQYYEELFQGQPKQPQDFALLGPEAEQCVKYEAEGLRITLPAGKNHSSTGLTTTFGVRGDFAVTVRYEIFQEPAPADAGTPNVGTRSSLTVTLDRPLTNDASIRRKITPNQPVHILSFRALRKDADGKPDMLGNISPVREKTGRFRMVRTGADIAYYLAEGLDEEFTLLATHPFGADDLKNIQIYGQTSSPKAVLDVRFSDLHIGAAALLPKALPAQTSPRPAPGRSSIPGHLKATFHQDFREIDLKNQPFLRMVGPDIQRDERGLRITLAKGHGIPPHTGPVPRFAIRGDFEMTLAYEILAVDQPDKGYGVGVGMWAQLESPAKDAVAVARRLRTNGTTIFMSSLARTSDGQPRQQWGKTLPSASPRGKLRLQRLGAMVHFLVAEGDHAEFIELDQMEVSTTDVQTVHLFGGAGNSESGLDLRLLDFTVHAEALPGLAELALADLAPPRLARRWVVVIMILLACAFFGGLWLRNHRKVTTAAGARLPLSFPCSACGKTLKARAELAGQMVKCPRCSKTVLVP